MDEFVFCKNFGVKDNLGELKKRLTKGMKLKGRIIDCPKENRYILRIWGYNIYTESKKHFSKYDNIDLRVKEIEPELVFDLKRSRHNTDSKMKTNIIV